MKKILATILFLAIGFTTVLNAQDRLLKKVLELPVLREGGQNGGAVAWHPKQKKYYAAMAGNASFPLVVFDEKGKVLSDEDLTTMFDIRGLWYNSKKGELQMNGYFENGWAKYILNDKGIPTDIEVIVDDMAQPEENSVGEYSAKEDVVYFLDSYGSLSRYYPETGSFKDDVLLYLGGGNSKEEEFDIEYDNYNFSYAAITNENDAAILNEKLKLIEVFSTETGKLKRKLKLPSNAPVDTWMNFSYCNGIFWLFDKDERKWIGYK